MKLFGKHIKANKIGVLAVQAILMFVLLSGCSKARTDIVNLDEKNSQNNEAGQNISEELTVEEDQTTVLEEETSEDQALPQRVIALSKSNAELWVLAGGELVGTSEDALNIEGIGEGVEDLGDMDKVSLEAITALEPDLLILFGTEPAQKALGEAASEIGIPVLFTNIDGFEDYEKVMKEFTDLTGREDLYQKNVVSVREEIDEILKKVPEGEEKTYLFLHVSATKSKAEKNDYFASEIFNSLGLRNIASDDSSFDELSMEAIVSADPDYIFVVPRGNEKKALESFDSIFVNDPAWESLTAVKEGRYTLLSKDLFGLKPNDKWADAYKEAYDLLYTNE